uniref:6-phosphogluconate dehydrogenase n=1 Tax=Candidatus Kentrum sp. UNK TaxID=2126344 RepID=A0A451B158_9GAMM|nr:MAG: 6-phosphogluconate dehydrogenase [Candidatus Kentron sp. UNK]VFK72010.1 MAG: 6-phosphogluconate dehydrogenase [Candidatus Kentron sp. UNK]
MNIGMIGLGKMGAGMTKRLLQGGHRVVAFDENQAAMQVAELDGAQGARDILEVIERLSPPPRVAWVMVPAGEPTQRVIDALGRRLHAGDIIVDGGNSHYKDSMRRAVALKGEGIDFLDVGVSGGVWGITEGYGMMVGGKPEAVKRLRPVFAALAPAPDRGWGHVGPTGAGHFVKMIHNGIEYGLMQAYAEGFDLLHRKSEFAPDLGQIAEIWRHGGVIRSWLLDLIARALKENPTLDGIAPFVPDSGEGRWTVLEAMEHDMAAPIITLSLMQRFRSREEEGFSDRLLAAMRHQFGGHAVKKA